MAEKAIAAFCPLSSRRVSISWSSMPGRGLGATSSPPRLRMAETKSMPSQTIPTTRAKTVMRLAVMLRRRCVIQLGPCGILDEQGRSPGSLDDGAGLDDDGRRPGSRLRSGRGCAGRDHRNIRRSRRTWTRDTGIRIPAKVAHQGTRHPRWTQRWKRAISPPASTLFPSNWADRGDGAGTRYALASGMNRGRTAPSGGGPDFQIGDQPGVDVGAEATGQLRPEESQVVEALQRRETIRTWPRSPG